MVIYNKDGDKILKTCGIIFSIVFIYLFGHMHGTFNTLMTSQTNEDICNLNKNLGNIYKNNTCILDYENEFCYLMKETLEGKYVICTTKKSNIIEKIRVFFILGAISKDYKI